MMSDRSLLFAGLPSTGKTTYLALVNVAIQARRDDDVRLISHKGNFEYINQISADLEACRVAEHTQVGEEGALELDLAIGGSEAHLRIPDISGETWEEALDQREWSLSFDEYVASCDGLVLFISASSVDMGGTLVGAMAGERALADGAARARASGPGASEGGALVPRVGEGSREQPAAIAFDSPVPSAHQRARQRATQVDAVDLLQMVGQRNHKRPLRLSVIFSAWDTIHGVTPIAWFEETFPLFAQYLRNSQVWAWEIFGVSAQGGDFSTAEVRKQLLEKDVVARAVVVEAAGSSASVYAPITWALQLG